MQRHRYQYLGGQPRWGIHIGLYSNKLFLFSAATCSCLHLPPGWLGLMRDLGVNTSFCPQFLMYGRETHVGHIMDKWTRILLHNRKNKPFKLQHDLPQPSLYKLKTSLFTKVVGTICMLSQNALGVGICWLEGLLWYN